MTSHQPVVFRPALSGLLAVVSLSLLSGCMGLGSGAKPETKAAAQIQTTPDPVQTASVAAPNQSLAAQADRLAYHDPRVSTHNRKTFDYRLAPPGNGQAQAVLLQNGVPVQVADAETAAAMAQQSAAPHSLFSAPSVQADAVAGNGQSPAPSALPGRPFQATVASVYSLQTQQPQVEVPQQAKPQTPPVVVVTPQSSAPRPPTKAEILAGLAPDPHQRRTATRRQVAGAPGAMMNPAIAARLQASMPTAMPAMANSTGASEMEQIEGAPQAQSMTKDSFIKKFLSKMRGSNSGSSSMF
ncbi:hypothetical protein NAC44_11255 [Allorhizobium sp. BGMRC 0089]|uniref:hypothetical protein n=1 Tax=Allorhizobium sonneratiae TaxID=2934936 RepID=UPI0020346059|nr:hypothetical protein [Allorhizobium sonneratiae]MCM2292901.1 hypothetical protein [Allorhizobium sonneratiae]